ncbi:cis-prenyltransferase 4, chloroplastic-like [Andrographis paniculata]|uniref:cis-prenyltransferase 4, chloroplastic-like n=1 Tax=Andrographis paniculata TaxID=175694 RepID=UPI0021E83FFC|nr:cis-prenyltransferase 4, chloroplastic-like [Andrographis paniculata]
MIGMALHPLNLRLSFTPSVSKFADVQCPTLHLGHRSSHVVRRPLSSSANGMPSVHCDEEESVELPAGLRRELMPGHVAVIMDGNRRWARTKDLPVQLGYEAGFRAFRRLVELCCRWGIKVLTVFAFSSDNWVRPKVETDFLMALFERGLKDEAQHLMGAGVRISLIGDSSKLLKSLQNMTANATEASVNNPKLHLILAVDYSGQSDIVQACQKLAVKVKDGLIKPEDINKLSVERELETNCTDIPSPDLLIRTSGEQRISNFLLWQLAYSELHFANSLWPDFGESDFREALISFQQRQRRYGGRKF